MSFTVEQQKRLDFLKKNANPDALENLTEQGEKEMEDFILNGTVITMPKSDKPSHEEVLQSVEAINEMDREAVDKLPAPVLKPSEVFGPKGGFTKEFENSLDDGINALFVDSLHRLADRAQAPKPVPRAHKKDGYVTNTAFRDSEALRALQRDLHRNKHKKGTK